MSCCTLSRTMTSTRLSRTGTAKSKVNTPLSVTWRNMGGKKIPLHGWPMSLTAAMAKPRFRFARKAPKERCCPEIGRASCRERVQDLVVAEVMVDECMDDGQVGEEDAQHMDMDRSAE